MISALYLISAEVYEHLVQQSVLLMRVVCFLCYPLSCNITKNCEPQDRWVIHWSLMIFLSAGKYS